MKQLWKIICLAYQGDAKHCTDPCLHCARIEDALAVELAVSKDIGEIILDDLVTEVLGTEGTPVDAIAKIQEMQTREKTCAKEIEEWNGKHQLACMEIERLTLENWQLKGALGYSVPSHIDQGDFKCGLCEARRNRPQKFAPPHLRGQGTTREVALAAAICSAMGYAWPCTYDRYSGKWAKEAVSKYWIEIAEHALEANKEYDLEDMGPAPVRSAWPYD